MAGDRDRPHQGELVGDLAPVAGGPGEPVRELSPAASTTSMTSTAATKKPQAVRKRWFVVEVAAG